MRAKLIKEDQNFERTNGSRREVINKTLGHASYDNLLDELLNPDMASDIEIFVNDYFIDTIARKFGNRFQISDLKKAVNVLIGEHIDNWAEADMYEEE